VYGEGVIEYNKRITGFFLLALAALFLPGAAFGQIGLSIPEPVSGGIRPLPLPPIAGRDKVWYKNIPKP
jgi:hypothetical protein